MTDIASPDEILINSLRYHLAGPVSLQSSRREADVVRIPLIDTRAGIGHYKQREALSSPPAKVWFGLGETMVMGSITLPPLATSAGSPSGVAASVEPLLIYEWVDQVWTVWGNEVYTWSGPSGTTWSTSQRTLATTPYSSISHTDSSGSRRMFLLCGDNIDYVNTSGTWSRLTATNAHYGVSYNSFLWTISDTGILFRNASGTDAWSTPWTARAVLPVGASKVTALFMYRNASGDPAIHAKTTEGVWVYDDTNDKWYPTELTYPRHPNAGKAAGVWRGLQGENGTEVSGAWIPVGMGVYGYVASDRASVMAIGPDLEDGVPSGYDGRIVGLTPTHNYVVILMDATTSDVTDADYGYLDSTTHYISGGDTFETRTGRAWLAANQGLGWHVRWEGATTDRPPHNVIVSQAYGGQYRLYWDANNTLYWMDIPQGIANFREIPTQTFGANTGLAGIKFPFLVGSGPGNNDLLVRVLCRVSGASSTETVTIGYAVNFSTYLDLPIIQASGLTTFTIDPGADNLAEGALFDYLSLRVKLSRGATTTNRPVIEYLAIDYIPGQPKQSLWRIPIDTTQSFGQRSSNGILDELLALIDPSLRIELIWKNQATNTSDIHMCTIIGIEGASATPGYEHGIYNLICLEV